MQAGRGVGRGGGKRGGRGLTASITVRYGPPLPQKPTTQISLKQALSRHAKAKMLQEERQQAEQGEEQRLPLPAALPGPASPAEADQAPQQHAPGSQPTQLHSEPYDQHPMRQPQKQLLVPSDSRQQLLGSWAFGQGTPGCSSVSQPAWALGAAAATAVATREQTSAPPKEWPSFSGIEGQHTAALPTAYLPPHSSGLSSLPLLPGNSATMPNLASRRPPLAPSRPVGVGGTGVVSAAAAGPAAGGWAPKPAVTPAACRDGQPGGKEERRLRLQRLLCDAKDPFAPASSGRWAVGCIWMKGPASLHVCSLYYAAHEAAD